MTAPPQRTITVSLPSNSPTPLKVVVPDGFLDKPSAVIVTANRAFVRQPTAQFLEAPLHTDATGMAVSADVADFHAVVADLENEKQAMAAVIAEAKSTIEGLLARVPALRGDVERDVDGVMERIEKWIGIKPKVAAPKVSK